MVAWQEPVQNTTSVEVGVTTDCSGCVRFSGGVDTRAGVLLQALRNSSGFFFVRGQRKESSGVAENR